MSTSRPISTSTLDARTTLQIDLPYEHHLAGSQSVGWWGMVMLILTEAALFAALISAYYFLRFNSPTWPTGDIERPELLLPSINTVILLASSLPMQMALRSIRRGSRSGLLIGVTIAWLLGALFLGLQAIEYSRSSFTPQTNAYGSLFFIITGLHGLHVLIGLGLAATVWLRGLLGHFDSRRFQAVENSVLYWHFVDAVWIVVFTSLYLSPYLAT